MPASSTKIPLSFIAAWIMTGIGFLCFAGLAFFRPGYAAMKGVGLIAAACICCGVGEILNHPKEHVFVPENERVEGEEKYRRRRNICALGNLFVILAILLFFVGLGTLLYLRG